MPPAAGPFESPRSDSLEHAVQVRDGLLDVGVLVLAGAGLRSQVGRKRREHEGKTVIKEEQMPDGRRKLILKDESTGAFSDLVT
jgi:hypothetical protein